MTLAMFGFGGGLGGGFGGGLAAQEPPAPADEPDLADELLRRLDEVDAGGAGAEGSWRRDLTLSGILAVATLVSEDLTCIAGGLLVARKQLSYPVAAAACFAGIFLGDLLLVLVGRLLGEGALRRRPFSRLVRPGTVERSELWFRERGTRVVFASRFVPGSRLPLFLAAGILRAPILPIAGALALAALIWTPLLVGLSAWTGGAMLRLFARFERWALPALVGAAILTWLVLRWLVPLFTWRGRRLLLSRWRRLTKWEFWPSWLFQAPVLLHALRLGWKHGGIGTFAAANPGIPSGGFVEESKSQILRALGDGPIARFVRFSVADLDRSGPAGRTDLLRGVLAEAGLDFPVVLKPDIGERGLGVTVVRDDIALAELLASATGDWIAQEYVAGEEFGVFYARFPHEPRGRIISITAKRFPLVVGDGRRALEELILADERAVCMAGYYLDVNSRRLDWVPAAGTAVQLVEIGNHCRGTIFLDGREHATEELTAAIDAIARRFDGFHFGRFDLRAPSVAEFRSGRGLRILELNGVTSEATHIYEPGAGLIEGWRTLFAQWTLAFEIGAANIERGARRPTLRELLALLRARRGRFATIAAALEPKGN